MYIKHKSFIIRSACVKDVQQLTTWWNDGAIMAHAGFPNGSGETLVDVENLLKQNCVGKREILMIEKDENLIGEMVYRMCCEHTVEIGIKICDFSMQNKGYGKIIICMLINELFQTYSFEKIVLDTNLHNVRAQYVYEQLGFQKIRINNDAWIDQLGQPQSSVDYELIPNNFIKYDV